ncbi:MULTISPECIES: ATP-binding protein [Streptomyces]|uniref:Regulatory protein n=1 Tax=Streptomyces katrae TaxID=68223 RepID=A0A0F4JMW3_9ACTN|nr:HAMP domain-containing histidine kinase [Streptomyces katrae]KJY35707.1 regulatory protein [Streptomyces katrae]
MLTPFSAPFFATPTACPVAPDHPAQPAPPDGLSCSMTLPASARSAGIARQAVRAALHAYALDPLEATAVQAASELMGSAWRMDPYGELYLSLRHRDDALRLIVYDGHPAHAQPRLAALCEARRRATLRVFAALVRDHGGEWGVGPSREPGGGTRTWATLPLRVRTA